MQHQQSSQLEYYEYTIQPGDTFSGVLSKMYGTNRGDGRYEKSKDYVLSINPHIKDPNFIRAGDVIRLGIYPWSKPKATSRANLSIPPSVNPHLITDQVAKQDRQNFWALSWLEHNSKALTVPGGIVTGATTNLLSPGNRALITEVSDLYAQYKAGVLTKGQYDYRRKMALDRLRNHLGPAETLLFGKKSTHESIRIARRGGIPATAHIQRHATRIGKLAKFARSGGIVLGVVGVTASCMEISNTADQNKKNDILVETVASTTAGVMGGALVGVFLVSNPVGWGTALVLALGTAAAGYMSGRGAVKAYDSMGRPVDFVSGLKVDAVCR